MKVDDLTSKKGHFNFREIFQFQKTRNVSVIHADAHLLKRPRKCSKMDFRWLVPRKLIRVRYTAISLVMIFEVLDFELFRFKVHKLSSKMLKNPGIQPSYCLGCQSRNSFQRMRSYTHPNPKRNWKIVHYILALSPLKMLRINIYSKPDLKF